MVVKIIMHVLVLFFGIFYSEIVNFYYDHLDEYSPFTRKPPRFKNPKLNLIFNICTSTLICSFAIHGLVKIFFIK